MSTGTQGKEFECEGCGEILATRPDGRSIKIGDHATAIITDISSFNGKIKGAITCLKCGRIKSLGNGTGVPLFLDSEETITREEFTRG
jgi:hypothetical protein